MLLNKPEMAAEMVVYALASGFSAEHLLADAWFGNKTTLRLTQATDLTAIVRMKKEKTQYRYSYYRYGVRCTTLADAKGLCSHHVRKQWQSILETRYHFKLLDIELNLASSSHEMSPVASLSTALC